MQRALIVAPSWVGDTVLAQPRWAYLRPLTELRALWRELRMPQHRLRMPSGERRKDGTLVDKQNRMGPLTLAARTMALDRVLDIQSRCNTAAVALGRPIVDMLNAEEEHRIRELVAAGTWPRRWSGHEPLATDHFDEDCDDLFTAMTVNGRAAS